MRATVTEQQIARYKRDGFLLMDDFLTPGELEEWRAVVERALHHRLQRDDGLSNAGRDDYYRRVFTQVSGLTRLDARMAELLVNPRLGELAGRLAGVDAVRLWNDQALFKPPFGNPTAWHLDAPYWSFQDGRAITVWVALDDATLENGCLWYLPGSHRSARFDAIEIGSDLGGIFERYPQWRAIESAPAALPAGGAVWHAGLIAHGAGANMTPRGRRAMTCAYMPDGVVFNGKRDDFVLPEAYARSLSVGDALDDEGINPLVWSRAERAVAR